MKKYNGLLSLEEVAEILGVTNDDVLGFIDAGLLRSFRVKEKHFIQAEGVNRLINPDFEEENAPKEKKERPKREKKVKEPKVKKPKEDKGPAEKVQIGKGGVVLITILALVFILGGVPVFNLGTLKPNRANCSLIPFVVGSPSGPSILAS